MRTVCFSTQFRTVFAPVSALSRRVPAHSMWAQALSLDTLELRISKHHRFCGKSMVFSQTSMLMTPKRRFKLIQLRLWSSGCIKIIFFPFPCSIPTSGESAP